MPEFTQTWLGLFNTPVQPTFTVPAGIFFIDVVIGGTSGGGTSTTGHPAGWGPMFTGTLAVTPGEILYMQVGALAGSNGEASGTGINRGIAGWPDGGTGGLGPSFNKGGGGGGSSRIWRNGIGSDLLVLVSGGGGIGFSLFQNSPNPGVGNGLAPPGEPTINGPTEGRGHILGSTGGRPASISAGGAIGTGGGSPTAGSAFQGGNGGTGTGTTGSLTASAGGGGGGYYGGGGGGTAAGGGGGGMSFIDLAEGWSSTLWDLARPLSIGAFQPFRSGSIKFTWRLPDVGGWSLGLVSKLG